MTTSVYKSHGLQNILTDGVYFFIFNFVCKNFSIDPD